MTPPKRRAAYEPTPEPTPEQWEALRAPFPPGKVGKLPKGKEGSPKANCAICGGYHGPGMFHLDYVGHAHITERLNEVDPTWTLEPVYDPPMMFDVENRLVYLWARLTVLGVSHIDVGCSSTSKAEWPKDLWSDCVTRCAMRFGVALEMWQKLTPVQDQSHERDPARRPTARTPEGPRLPKGAAQSHDPDLDAVLDVLREDVTSLDQAGLDAWAAWKAEHGGWWATLELAVEARNVVMGLLQAGTTEPWDPVDGAGAPDPAPGPVDTADPAPEG